MHTVTPEQLTRRLGALPPFCRVVAGGNGAVPWLSLACVDAALECYRLFMLHAPRGLPDRDGVVYETPFVGAGMRDSKRLSFLPTRLSLVPNLLRTSHPPDVVLVRTTTPRRGRLSLGIEVDLLPAAIESVRERGGLLVAEIDPTMPFIDGDGVFPADLFDVAVETDRRLVDATPTRCRTGDPAVAAVATNVARLVPDGATLQLGVGTLPDAVLGCLRDRRGLRIWSEMVSDGLLALDRSGALLPGATITASFCEGSAELYAWLDDNPRVRFARSERVNDPALIARQPCMRSINTALQVDLYAQANAARRPRALGGRIYSGFGGQPDFVVGALHANGGAAIIALPSWHQRAGASTIVPALDVPATSFQPSHVVTERGVAHLACLDQREQAAALIGCADPSARPELAAAAELMGLLATPAPAHAP